MCSLLCLAGIVLLHNLRTLSHSMQWEETERGEQEKGDKRVEEKNDETPFTLETLGFLTLFLIYIQGIEHFFCVYVASSKHEEGLENLRQLCKPES